jgi:APA family basic amino acid/polyamine antiporter
VTVDFIFFGMTAAALFMLRRRSIGSESIVYRVPGHPLTTALFVLSCAGIVASAVIASPRNSAIALCIMLAALPVYYFWTRFRRVHSKFKTAQT